MPLVIIGSPRPRVRAAVAVVLLLLSVGSLSVQGRQSKKKADYGLGFSTEVEAPESEVLKAVEEVVNDGIIQGSKEYNKDRNIEKADAATSSRLFSEWKEPGKVFFKVREKVLAPVNFNESNDEGTLAVRYVVTSKDAARTILRIDAVFVEDFRHVVHPSNGSVETAEYKDIQEHVDAIETLKKEAEESSRQRQEELAKKSLDSRKQQEDAAALASSQTSEQTLEQHVQNLRRQLERVVKAPGAQLRSAPFHTASSLKTLDAGTQVVILITSSYWYGVETEDGQHGWISREQLELP